MKTTKIILAFALLLPVTSRSQWVSAPDFDARAQRGIYAVYNLEFEKAEEEFTALARYYPSHPAGTFFLGMIEWWKILIDIENESRDDLFVQKMDDVIDLCDSLLEADENDVTALFFKGGALGFRGRLRANRDSWIKAANDGRLALPIVQRAYKIAPDNYDILLGIGIYNYYAFTIPEKYPIVKPIMVFFPAGDKGKGIEQLEQASNHARYASVEATYFLLQLYFNYERLYAKSLELSQSLLQRFPHNVLFHRYVGRSLFNLSHFKDAEIVFEEIVNRCGKQRRGYGDFVLREAHYYLGMAKMHRKNYGEALHHFYESDKLSRSLDTEEQSGFMVLANLRIGMIYDLQHKRQYAVVQYQKVSAMKEYDDSRGLAQKYLKEPFTK